MRQSKPELAPLEETFHWENVDIVPVLPQKILYAAWVRNLLIANHYDVLCLNLPEYVSKNFLIALNDLPNYLILGIDEIGRKQIGFIPISFENPLVAAAYTARQMEIPIQFVDQALPKKHFSDLFGDERYIKNLGFKRFYDLSVKHTFWGKYTALDASRNRFTANQLWEISHAFKKVLFICDFHAWHKLSPLLSTRVPPVEPPHLAKNVDIFKVSKRSIKNTCKEIPYVLSAFTHQYLNAKLDEQLHFQTQAALDNLICECLNSYKQQISDEERFYFRRYLESTTRKNHRLVPTQRDIIFAAKQTLSEEIAVYLNQLANKYIFNKPTKKYYLIDFSAKLASLTHPELPAEAPVPLSREMTHPLFKRLMEHRDERYTVLRPKKRNMASQPFEQLIDKLLKSIHKKLGDGPLFKKPLVPPVLIFEHGGEDLFPWKAFLQNKSKGKYDIIFYASSYVREFAFPGKNKCLFGGLAFFKQTLKNLNYFEHPDFKGHLCESLLYWSNFYHHQSIIPYIDNHPPQEAFLKKLDKNENDIFHLYPSQFPKQAIHELRKLYHLGSARLNQLLQQIP